MIPIGFVLGFYVDTVVKRWWSQFLIIPWPDDLLMLLSANSYETSKKTLKQMKTIMRYANLSYVLAARQWSSKVRAQYPTEQHIVSASECGFESL